MTLLYLDTMPSPVGEIALAVDGGGVLRFLGWEAPGKPLPLKRRYPDCEVRSKQAPAGIRKALQDYLAGDLTAIDAIPTAMPGTDFQRKVWAALCEIPAGTSWSYKQLAIHIGNPKAAQAVGMANNANPIAIVVPCHRVIGADGKLVGYGGGIECQRWLLRHEGALAL